jgi:hypothetical protein
VRFCCVGRVGLVGASLKVYLQKMYGVGEYRETTVCFTEMWRAKIRKDCFH